MPYGRTGTTLEINLSRGKVEKRQTDPELDANYLAGKGTNTKLLWDRVPPEVGAFSPDNLFIVGAGLLSGTLVPGANRTCITYKSPVTDLHCYSNLGGFFGPELKYAGYDTIIITGKSPSPVYLWINNDQVEIRDANHLWGKTPHETQRIIREETKNEKVQTMAIGPAGENKVYFATVEHNATAVAGRGGAGTIMGDKNLKAIAVYGTKDVTVANTPRLIELGEHIISRTWGTRQRIVERTGYTYFRFGVNWGDEGNCSGVRTPEHQKEIHNLAKKATDFINQNKIREVACANCVIRCKQAYLNPEGGHTFIKCGPYYPMIATQILEPEFSIAYLHLCEKYGLDLYTTGNCIAFAITLYEKGILTKKDTDGLHLEWKNAKVALSLIEKIARREGIGDILANGTYRAARQIGNGAENYAFDSKKLDLMMIRVYHQHHFALAAAINDKGIERMDSSAPGLVIHLPREQREAYIADGWFSYPKAMEKYLLDGDDPATGNPDLVANCQFSAYDQEQYAIADATGLCTYWLGFWMCPAINSRTLITDLISSATGMDIDEAELTKIARRIITLGRAYNVREGIRRKDDCVPKHVFQRTPPPPEMKLDPVTFKKLIDTFYKISGWDSDGIPTKETLGDFGLDYVRQDLEQRGILTA